MLTIRPIEERDLDSLLAIINQPSVIRYMPLERPVSMTRIRRWYDSFRLYGQPSIFVMEEGGVIGAFSVRKDGKLTIWIGQSHQRKGYGTKAMAWLEAYAKKNGLSRLWLECFKDNDTALRFYRKLGYIEIGMDEDDIVMEMKL